MNVRGVWPAAGTPAPPLRCETCGSRRIWAPFKVRDALVGWSVLACPSLSLEHRCMLLSIPQSMSHQPNDRSATRLAYARCATLTVLRVRACGCVVGSYSAASGAGASNACCAVGSCLIARRVSVGRDETSVEMSGVKIRLPHRSNSQSDVVIPSWLHM